jgi:glycogen debranching enzyme
MNDPRPTALRNTCTLTTPNPIINHAFTFAKDNIARCMRFYTLGWGMSNAPHGYTIVVGRDTGWMGIGADFVAPWFAPEALGIFRDRQKENGQILEYVDMESGASDDYGLNVADNTPLYIWGVYHHWQQFGDVAFLDSFLPSIRAAGDHLLREVRENGLLYTVPNGVEMRGISSWRNIIPEAVIAGEVTEINALSAFALRLVAEMTGDTRYSDGADRITRAINDQLWLGDHYALMRYAGAINPQMTGDNIFPVLFGVADEQQSRHVLNRLAQPDFWNTRGVRTVPKDDPQYDPGKGYGLVGGSWPNLTLWYAAALARFDPNAALKALEMVALPVVGEDDPAMNIKHSEFAEYFDGDTGRGLGMNLSPWVAPTFLWAVLEGLLGLRWHDGVPTFAPHWPDGWDEVRIERLPCKAGLVDVTLRRAD